MDSLDSLLEQTYGMKEIVIVVDGSKDLYERIIKLKDGLEGNIIVLLNERNLGLSESRNRGIERASGDVIAFFDDDAVADIHWIEELVKMYEIHGAIAAGGKLLPLWIDGKGDFLPEEYYWLIGATHKGFPDNITEVRNTFGSNISFRSQVIKALGGFKSELGVYAEKRSAFQGEETEFCIRMKKRFGRGVIYDPNAIVYHKIPADRIKLRSLLRRAFWQGYSKRVMEKLAGSQLSEERNFLKYLFFQSIPDRIGKILKNPSFVMLEQIICIFLLTLATGLGYIVKIVKG